MLEAVLFDMDGILYDSEQFYMNGTIHVMRSLGYTGDEKKLYAVVGTTMEGTYQIFYDLLKHQVPWEEIVKANENYYKEHPVPYKEIMFPHVPEVLEDIRRKGLKTACCSSSPHQTVLDSLRSMGIGRNFDVVLSGESVSRPKPDPMIYNQAALKLGVKNAGCVVYEDSRMGIEAGKRAGMFVIAREDKRFSQDQSEADMIVKDIQEMEEVLFREDLWKK